MIPQAHVETLEMRALIHGPSSKFNGNEFPPGSPLQTIYARMPAMTPDPTKEIDP
jgi:hypothetical protein